MPIVDREPKRVFSRFEEHIEETVRSVLPMPGGMKLGMWIPGEKHKASLSFVRGGAGLAAPVPLDTNVGRLYLSLEQDLVAERTGRSFRLRTARYSYRFSDSDQGRAKALIRWEYNGDLGDEDPCRSHAHFATAISLGDSALLLDKLHVPTGWVLIEHLLRFVFKDLEVTAKTEKWPQVLRESERRFFEEFTSREYKHR